MLWEYDSNNVMMVICATPWMFPPLDILLEYWIEHVTFGLLYVKVFTFPTEIFRREFEALQLVVLVAFGAMD